MAIEYKLMDESYEVHPRMEEIIQIDLKLLNGDHKWRLIVKS